MQQRTHDLYFRKSDNLYPIPFIGISCSNSTGSPFIGATTPSLCKILGGFAALPARPFELTRSDSRRTIAEASPLHGAYGGMDDTDNQEPVDPLTIGELITLAEAAEYAGLSKGSLHEYAKRGRLKAKKIGLYWVTTYAAVDEYLASRNLDNIPKKYRDRS